MRELIQLKTFIKSQSQKNYILASIVETQGSTYKKKGAMKLITSSGQSCGLLSGGCLEDSIILEAINNEEPIFEKEFDSSNQEDRLFGHAIGCSGKLRIKFEKLSSSIAEERINMSLKDQEFQLIIFGAGADIDSLYELATWSKWDVKVITHRNDLFNFRTEQGWNIEKYNLNTEHIPIKNPLRTAVLLMSHNYPSDLEFLNKLSHNPPEYIGVLGPSSRKKMILEDLYKIYKTSWPTEYLENIHGPIGISDLGKGEDAIALSVVSQLQSIFFNFHD